MTIKKIVQEYLNRIDEFKKRDGIFSTEELLVENFIVSDVLEYFEQQEFTLEYIITLKSSFGLDLECQMEQFMDTPFGELTIYNSHASNIYMQNTFGFIQAQDANWMYVSYIQFHYSNDYGYEAYNFKVFRKTSIKPRQINKVYLGSFTNELIDDCIDSVQTKLQQKAILEIVPQDITDTHNFQAYLLSDIDDLHQYIIEEISGNSYYYRYVEQLGLMCLHINEGKSNMRIFYLCND